MFFILVTFIISVICNSWSLIISSNIIWGTLLIVMTQPRCLFILYQSHCKVIFELFKKHFIFFKAIPFNLCPCVANFQAPFEVLDLNCIYLTEIFDNSKSECQRSLEHMIDVSVNLTLSQNGKGEILHSWVVLTSTFFQGENSIYSLNGWSSWRFV